MWKVSNQFELISVTSPPRPGGQPLRLKVEAVATQYETVDGFQQRSAGAGVFGALRAFRHGEVFVRGDQYWEDVDGDSATFGTVGASYSPSAALGRDYRDLRITAFVSPISAA